LNTRDLRQRKRREETRGEGWGMESKAIFCVLKGRGVFHSRKEKFVLWRHAGRRKRRLLKITTDEGRSGRASSMGKINRKRGIGMGGVR